MFVFVFVCVEDCRGVQAGSKLTSLMNVGPEINLVMEALGQKARAS